MIQFKKAVSRIPLGDVLDRIEYADGIEIDSIIQAIRNRYSRLHPDWELIILSLRRGDEAERRQNAQLLIDFLRQQYL